MTSTLLLKAILRQEQGGHASFLILRKKLERLCDRGAKTAPLQLPLEHLDIKIPLAQTGKRLLRREDMDLSLIHISKHWFYTTLALLLTQFFEKSGEWYNKPFLRMDR